ncbi:phosphotransferase [Clostridium paridis]|uniref:Phosphotransferase n=1 Tax=Clostridium paridis TaxID=2803863 RepID=A0A937FC80_9CLOT|nr:phosphotransferase [Clostridium paridis]MBL4930608.1 phosphotransferase [Clostridium paridis]
MIPENKLIAVKNALQETFGVNEFEDIQEMTAGLSSALVFRIVVKGKSYLLRIITRDDAMGDPTHQFTCMKSAADAGLAPNIKYLNIQDRISITDFVETQPFSLDEAKTFLPEVLHKLHSLSPFPKTINYIDSMDSFVQRFQDAKIIPENITKEIFEQYKRIKNVYPSNDDDFVSCHNDLKPENILYDGEKAWLVDWEAAFLNDRYVDLAVVGNFVIRNEQDEIDFLSIYFGEELNEYRHARFFLMSQMMHIFYFALFMQIGSKRRPIDINTKRQDFREIHDNIWEGKINLTDNEAKLNYALAHMDQFMLDVKTKRFEESLKIVADYN